MASSSSQSLGHPGSLQRMTFVGSNIRIGISRDKVEQYYDRIQELEGHLEEDGYWNFPVSRLGDVTTLWAEMYNSIPNSSHTSSSYLATQNTLRSLAPIIGKDSGAVIYHLPYKADAVAIVLAMHPIGDETSEERYAFHLMQANINTHCLGTLTLPGDTFCLRSCNDRHWSDELVILNGQWHVKSMISSHVVKAIKFLNATELKIKQVQEKATKSRRQANDTAMEAGHQK